MRNHKGFTLIELMIVVCILGIIVAVAVPQIQKWRNKADGITTSFGQAPVQSTFTDTSRPNSNNRLQVGDQQVTVFEYDGSTYLMTYGGGIVKHR